MDKSVGRVLASARQHHFIVDGPVQNGCPGEALTPPSALTATVRALASTSRASALTLDVAGDGLLNVAIDKGAVGALVEVLDRTPADPTSSS